MLIGCSDVVLMLIFIFLCSLRVVLVVRFLLFFMCLLGSFYRLLLYDIFVRCDSRMCLFVCCSTI